MDFVSLDHYGKTAAAGLGESETVMLVRTEGLPTARPHFSPRFEEAYWRPHNLHTRAGLSGAGTADEYLFIFGTVLRSSRPGTQPWKAL